MSVPDFCMPLVGYRRWKINGSTLAPWSVDNKGNPWRPRNVAIADAVPAIKLEVFHGFVFENSQGLHAHRTLDEITPLKYIQYSDEAIGEVFLWGTVVEHTNGYRAEFAYPKRLITAGRNRRRDRAIAAAYGIPCVTVRQYQFELRKERYRATWKTFTHRTRRAFVSARAFIATIAGRKTGTDSTARDERSSTGTRTGLARH